MTADSPRLPDVEVDLSGQVAVVTGAGRGIGATMASALANAGAQVVLVGRCLETLKRTATAMGPQKGEAVPVAVDVVRADQVAKLRTDLNRR